MIEAQYAFCRDDPDRGRFIYALLFGPLGSEIAGELEPFKESLRSWTDAAVRRLAEAGIVARDRVEACATACRGLIVISTLDYLYHEKTLGRDLAREQVNDLLKGFGGNEKDQRTGIIIMSVWRTGILRGHCWAGRVLGRGVRLRTRRSRRRRPGSAAPQSRAGHGGASRAPGRSSGPSRSSARLRGWEQVTVGSKRSGRVIKVHHDIGDRVQPGEPLVELDPVDARLGVQQAESKYLGELVKLGITKQQAEDFVKKYGISEELLNRPGGGRRHRQGLPRSIEKRVAREKKQQYLTPSACVDPARRGHAAGARRRRKRLADRRRQLRRRRPVGAHRHRQCHSPPRSPSVRPSKRSMTWSSEPPFPSCFHPA